MALEILSRRIRGKGLPRAKRIVEKLLSGYWDHSHGILRDEARNMGLPVRYAEDAEAADMDEARAALEAYCEAMERDEGVGFCPTLLVSRCSISRYVQRWPQRVVGDDSPRVLGRGYWEDVPWVHTKLPT